MSELERQSKAMRESSALLASMRPGETVGTLTPENDPLRHLTAEERERIHSMIVPRKETSERAWNEALATKRAQRD